MTSLFSNVAKNKSGPSNEQINNVDLNSTDTQYLITSAPSLNDSGLLRLENSIFSSNIQIDNPPTSAYVGIFIFCSDLNSHGLRFSA
jgi:hypothetical protein